MRLALLVRIALATASLAGVTLVAVPAAAKCMMPGPALAPATGTVPPSPVLRLLVPSRSDNPPLPRVVARLSGKQVPVTVTVDTAAGDLRAYRVVVTASGAGPLAVDLLDAQGAVIRTWTLEVDPKWQPPAPTAARVAVTHETSSWTCSHTRTRNLRFAGTAAAYRVVLADAPADKSTTSVIVPADPTAFFSYYTAPRTPPVTDVDLALGHVNCFGHTLEWTSDKQATILALWPDGSEQPVTRTPVRLAPP
jgi:hypothetical protein